MVDNLKPSANNIFIDTYDKDKKEPKIKFSPFVNKVTSTKGEYKYLYEYFSKDRQFVKRGS